MKHPYLTIILFIFFTKACVTEPVLKSLFLINKSNATIKIYLNKDLNHNYIYPDTLISNFEKRIFNESFPYSDHKQEIVSVASWKETFKIKAPQDTLSLFIFHSDTLAKYSWEEVRKDYKVLARYDLSLKDLERLNFELSYPPDSRMKGIKMYPR